MNFRKVFESASGLKYQKGNDGPFSEWDTSIKTGKEQKPKIKGKPHFKYEVAGQPPTNKPSCPYGEDTYNVRYSKTGSLTEAEFKELNDLGLLEEDEETTPASSRLYDDEDFDLFDDIKEEEIDEEDDFDLFEGEEEEEIDEADKEFYDWKHPDDEYDDIDFEEEEEEFDPEDSEFDSKISKYMNDGEGTLEDDYLSDDERHSALGKLNRGDDLEENIDPSSKNFEKYLKLLETEENEDNGYPSSDNPKSTEDPDMIEGTKLA
jgi:hypothetical protein